MGGGSDSDSDSGSFLRGERRRRDRTCQEFGDQLFLVLVCVSCVCVCVCLCCVRM